MLMLIALLSQDRGCHHGSFNNPMLALALFAVLITWSPALDGHI